MHMKSMKIRAVKLLTLSLILFIGACSNDEDDPEPTPAPSVPVNTTIMSALIDSVSWSSLNSKATGSIIDSVSNFSGAALDSSFIAISINQALSAGDTIDLGPYEPHAATFSTSTTGAGPFWTTTFNFSCNGQLIISSLDISSKLMTGTFHFKAYSATENTFKEITNGAFVNLPFATSATTGGANYFTVLINGSQFTASIISGAVQSGVLHLVGSDSPGHKSVGISIPSNIAANRAYPIGAGFTTYHAQYNPDSIIFMQSTTGTLFISSHNMATKRIEGIFRFDAEPYPLGGSPVFLTSGNISVDYY